MADWNRPGYSLKFLTLTLKNPEKINDPDILRERIRFLFKAVRKLLNEEFPKSRGCGAVASLEFTKRFTIHCHIVVYGHFVAQERLSTRWLEITGDSSIVDIRKQLNCLVALHLKQERRSQ